MILGGGQAGAGEGPGGAGSGKWLVNMTVVHCMLEWSSLSRNGGKEEKGGRISQLMRSFYITHTNLVLFTILSGNTCGSTYKCTPMLSISSLKSVFVTAVSVSIIPNTVWFHSFSWNFLGHWHPLPWNCKALQKTASLKRGVACFLCGNPGQDWTCVHKKKCRQHFAQLIGSKITEMASHYEQAGNQQMTRWC